MKKLISIAVLCMLMGCTQPGHYEQLTAQWNESTDTIVDAIEHSGLISDESFEELLTDIDVVQDAVVAAAKAYDEQAEEDQFIALLEGAQAANTASLPLNPYAAPIGGVLSIALAVAGVMAKKNGDKAKRSGDAVREIVAGIEAYKSEGGADALKNKLRTSTSPTTKAVIAEARN